MPVINGLTDLCHPCQALADVLTIEKPLGLKLENTLFLWAMEITSLDHSRADLGHVGNEFTFACPEGYQLDSSWLEQVINVTLRSFKSKQTSDVTTAVKTADAIYTDVWTSMGQEEETAIRKKAFADYQVNSELMAKAPEHARILHCLPAVRGRGNHR